MRELLWLQTAGTTDTELVGRDQIASLDSAKRTSVQLRLMGDRSSIGSIEESASKIEVTSLAPVLAMGRSVEAALDNQRSTILFVPDPDPRFDWATYASRCDSVLTTEGRFADSLGDAGIDEVVLVEPAVSIRPSEHIPEIDRTKPVCYLHARSSDWLSVEAFCEAWMMTPWTRDATLLLSSPDVPSASASRSVSAVAERCRRESAVDRIECIGIPTADQLDTMILISDLVVSIPITSCGWPTVIAKACCVGKSTMCTRVHGIVSHVSASTWIEVAEIRGGTLGDADLPRDHLVDLFRLSIERWPIEPELGRMLPSKMPMASDVLDTLSNQLSLEGV